MGKQEPEQRLGARWARRVQLLVHGIILENSAEKLWEYRCEVKGYVADQAETGIPKAPFGGKEEVEVLPA